MPKMYAKFGRDSKILPLDEIVELISDKGVDSFYGIT